MKKAIQVLAVAGLCLAAAAGAIFGVIYVNYGTPPAAQPLEQLSTADGQTLIQLDTDRILVTGPGASARGTTVTISQGGTYAVSGALTSGQIYIDAGSSQNVTLFLNGIDISHPSEAAIHVENAGHTRLVLAEGSVNRVQSGAEAALESSTGENASGGAIYARDDLSITGPGALQVFGYINNGIQTSNHLAVDSGNIEVTAINHGLKGKDSVTITGGGFSIRSGGDGIQSDDTTGESYGVVYISNGRFSIEAESDGVQAETKLEITGGEFSIVSGGGSDAITYVFGSWRDSDSDWDWENQASVSAKGLKSGGELRVTGGTFFVNSLDDALHANGSIHISNGTFTLASGDDGVHADRELTIEGGDIQITGSYEGLEANQLRLSGGRIGVVSSDDGINAYGGPSQGWGGSANTTEETPNLHFTGAEVTIDANGDGLDSNGNIYVEGGILLINGPAGFGNGALDSGTENGGVCVINGGTVLAMGSSGMSETFSPASGQCSFRRHLETPLEAGDEVAISDAQGEILFRHTAVKSASTIVFSCSELALGETYRLSAGGETVDITLDSVSTTSGSSGGRGGWWW